MDTNSDPANPITRIFGELRDVSRTPDGWTAKCPNCDDDTLAVAKRSDERLALSCPGKFCDLVAIMAGLGLDGDFDTLDFVSPDFEATSSAKQSATKQDSNTREAAPAGLVEVRASDVAERKQEYLWPPYLPADCVSVVFGDPAVGKTTALIEIAARVTKGEPMPHTNTRKPALSVLHLSPEDPVDTILVPRYRVARADLERVIIAEYAHTNDGPRTPRFPQLIQQIEESAKRNGVGLVIIDCLNSHAPNGADTHKDSAIREYMVPLQNLAKELGIAIVAVLHRPKSSQAKSALASMLGSGGFGAVVRSAIMVARDEDDKETRLWSIAKSSFTKDADDTTLSYKIVERGGHAVAEWGAAVAISADEIHAQGAERNDGQSAVGQATEWLRDLLASGEPMAVRDIKTRANEACHSWTGAIRRAKAGLDLIVGRDGFGKGSKSTWSLKQEYLLTYGESENLKQRKRAAEREGDSNPIDEQRIDEQRIDEQRIDEQIAIGEQVSKRGVPLTYVAPPSATDDGNTRESAEMWCPWWSRAAIEAAFDARTEIVPAAGLEEGEIIWDGSLPIDTANPRPPSGYSGTRPKYGRAS